MKNFFAFFSVLYNKLLYDGICRRFQRTTELFPELKEGIDILEIGFGKGTGLVNVISPYRVRTPWMFYENEPMYFAEIQSKDGKEGYLFAIRGNDLLVQLFYNTREKKEEIDFFFDFEGVITRDGKKLISLSTS